VDPGGSHTVDLASAYSKNGQGDLALQSYTALIQQEEARIQSGTYAREPELGKERLTSAYLHKMFEYVRQHRLEEARELMEHKIKPQVGGNTALLNRYIEDYQDEFY
ncbi:MAG: hypothetical protein OXT67_01030, partial [Zetaproteobacteria bacterium]|nr:hypothetical protein [Zetaproteobacteria bacterium]